jgi:uncharacterized protein (TIGR02271 family)
MNTTTNVDRVTESIALLEERLQIATRTIETGIVRISKRVVEAEHAAVVPLRHEQVEIERVDVDPVVVDRPAAPRQEGDVTIVPVYEEVLVRQWVLKQELRITRRATTEQRSIGPLMLRREEVAVVRMPIAKPSSL